MSRRRRFSGLVVTAPAFATVAAAVGLAAGCSDSATGPQTAEVERGRQVYTAQCTACHAQDPAQAGPLGPPVKGASRTLLEAKVLRGAYPDGYTPRRSTALMPPQPALAPDIPALASYLQ